MIHRKGNRILDAMERKVGHLALPQILRWIAGFQLLVWLLYLGSPGILDEIEFDQKKILSGEVWRLFSWVFFPRATNPIFVIIATLFAFFINDAMESEWRSFRLNVYVIATVLLLTFVGMLFDPGVFLTIVFYSSVFLAFATLHPNLVIRLMFIIPIKVKWLGFANAAVLFGIIALSGSILLGIITFFGLIPYILVFGPGFFQSVKAARRRSQYLADSKAASSGAFHVCATCEVTDETHPDREFRVTADGEEYCEECLEKSKGE